MLPIFWLELADDAYIHLRLVENFLQTGRPGFNDADTFKVGSSTGYILLLAMLSFVVEGPVAIRVVAMATAVAIGGLAVWTLRASSVPRLWASLFLLSAAPYVLLAGYGGMETPIIVALMLGAAISMQNGQAGPAIMLLAIGVWFRIEMALLFVLAIAHYLREGKRLWLVAYGWPMLALWATDLWLYGAFIPHAAGAKSLAYGHSLAKSIEFALEFGAGDQALGLLFMALLVWRLVAVLRKFRFGGPSDVFFGMAGGVLIAWMLGRSNLFTWYYAIAYTPFAIGALFMPWATLHWVFRGGMILVCTAYLLASSTLIFNRVASDFGADDRVTLYRSIGAALYEHCPDCSLATSEIGGLGYEFKGVVWDGFGLGDPEALQFHPMAVPEERASSQIGAIPAAYIQLRDPDFVVSMPIFSRSLRKSGLLQPYQQYTCPLGAKLWGGEGVDIYSKLPLPDTVLLQAGCRPVSRQ